MHEIAKQACLLLLGAVLSVIPGTAQQRPANIKTIIIGDVMEYRLRWVGDSTAFDTCQAFRVAGEPSNFPTGILQPIQQLLDRPVDECRRGAARESTGALQRIVETDSVIVGDSVSKVFLTVHRGERIHREIYVLNTPISRPDFAGVKTATLWGAIRIYQAPRLPPRPRN